MPMPHWLPRSGVAATAALLAKRAESTGEDFLLAIDAEGIPADKARPLIWRYDAPAEIGG